MAFISFFVIEMQSNVVKAFRQRLVRCGFTCVRIFDYGQGLYRVSYVSPEGITDYAYVRLSEMPFLPKVKYSIKIR